jgi:hypothetical protein
MNKTKPEVHRRLNLEFDDSKRSMAQGAGRNNDPVFISTLLSLQGQNFSKEFWFIG